MDKYVLRCAACGHAEFETSYIISCQKCGGFVEVEFLSMPDQVVDESYPSIFKYHRLMPYEADPIALQWETFCPTPIVEATVLSQWLGVRLFFKDETVMPSGTWKDREGYVSIHRLLRNKISDLVVFSSGNTATSLARSASLIRGPRLHIVVPEASKERIRTYRQFFDPEFVKLYFFSGSNDECIAEASNFAAEHGYAIEGGFANYARREGLKLLGLEVAIDWSEKADWYVQPVAGGIGIYSFYKAYKDLGRKSECPRILGVQAEICAPMVNAWRDGASCLEDRHIPNQVIPSEFVRVLRTRKPADSYPIVKQVLDQVSGNLESVSDADILSALRAFYREPYYVSKFKSSGMLVGLEPATALAGIIKSVETGVISKKETILLNVSGAAKQGDIKLEWLQDLI